MVLAYRVCPNPKEMKSVKVGVSVERQAMPTDSLPPAPIPRRLVIKSRLAIVSLHSEDELGALLKLNFCTLPPAVERALPCCDQALKTEQC